MKRFLRLSVALFVGVGIAYLLRPMLPKPHVKSPTTRYHGYKLNRLAIHHAKMFTVLISNEGFGGVSRGTGVLIDSTHVLTCAHMLEGSSNDFWLFPYPGGIVVKGKPILVSRSDDLAILELNRAVITSFYATFQENHYDGEPITIIGNILGSMKWFVSFGIISGDYDGFLLTDGLIHGGNSGGPWINERGEVVALTDWTLVGKEGDLGINGGISAKTINNFLKVWKSPTLEGIFHLMMGASK